MQTVCVSERTGSDGILNLRIPIGKPDAEYEVVLVLQPKSISQPSAAATDNGWPAGYFEETFGSITDETFVRPSQGELPNAVEIE